MYATVWWSNWWGWLGSLQRRPACDRIRLSILLINVLTGFTDLCFCGTSLQNSSRIHPFSRRNGLFGIFLFSNDIVLYWDVVDTPVRSHCVDFVLKDLFLCYCTFVWPDRRKSTSKCYFTLNHQPFICIRLIHEALLALHKCDLFRAV